MGCRVSNQPSTSSESDTGINRTITKMPGGSHSDDVDYKARLERKLCLAKDTPEPDFDISNCRLKEVPSGVFIICRVLRKENLNLSNNLLHSFNGGGSLYDLQLLHSLDVRFNKFKKLPDELCQLENLRELFLSNNQLTTLPATINRLTKLEILDISHNNILQINSINCMTHLRILNISGNSKLTKLPNELSTCDSLIDINLDLETIEYPPNQVTSMGTLEILKFLTTGDILLDREINLNSTSEMEKLSERLVKVERGEEAYDVLNEKFSREKLLMEQERLALEKNAMLEAELYQQQQKKKQELLQQLLIQNNEADNIVNKLQQERDIERNKLINDILNDEQNTAVLVEKLLTLRNEPDPMINAALIERDRLEEEKILENLRIQHSDLRKQEILSEMSNILAEEAQTIQMYQIQRDESSRGILEREEQTNELLTTIFENNDKDRNVIVNKILQDEELQKSAIISFISKNDSRTWGLVEQVRIVESQLATMTHYEIERRKFNMDERLCDLTDQRINLTYVLMDLLEQQEKRKQQLFDTLMDMENQKQNEKDFWLLQYQKLLDYQPAEVSKSNNSIDPLLGYNFLVNGVVHCIPFLSKLWQNENITMENISEDDLLFAGIKKETDRNGILKSIKQFIHDRDINVCQLENPTGPSQRINLNDNQESTEAMIKNNNTQPFNSNDNNVNGAGMSTGATTGRATQSSDGESTTRGEVFNECVICMDEMCKIIFLPCGHMCCCLNCQVDVEQCPMCRTDIERRIKVIQS